MIPWLLDALGLSSSGSALLRGFGVFRWVEFRAVLAVVLAFAAVVGCAPRTIRWLIAQKIGDHPEFHHRALNELTRHKSNVPTMGGVLIAGAVFAVTLLLADLRSFYVVLAMACLVSLCGIGFADDWLKLTAGRRRSGSRDGLRSWRSSCSSWAWPRCSAGSRTATGWASSRTATSSPTWPGR